MRKFALIVCILLLLLSLQGCINSSGAEIKSDKYGTWDKETAHLLDTEFTGTLPSAELVESFGNNYYYKFSQALLGDINFVVSIDLQMPDENCLAVQLSELEEKSQYSFSMDDKLCYIIQGSAANAADYMDEEIRDGMFYNFEFVVVNQETATIQYTSARVWDYYRDEVLIAALRPLLEESIQGCTNIDLDIIYKLHRESREQLINNRYQELKHGKNEIRAFRISDKALDELIWELLNKYGETLLELPEDSESIFHMNLDKAKDELTFYALEFGTPRQVDFDAIDELVKDKVESNSDSLSTPGVAPYKTLHTTFN